GSCVALCVTAGLGWSQEKPPVADEVQALRELIFQQQKQINELSDRLNNAVSVPQPIQLPSLGGAEQIPPPKGAEPVPVKMLDTKAVQTIIADYLKANPGAGMPTG